MHRIDLHVHTTYSDGSFTPKEVIDMAVKNKTTILSITDHDTVKAYTKKTQSYAIEQGIKLVTGVEISTRTDKVGIHILGYNIDVTNEDLIKTLTLLQNNRHQYLHDVSQKLKALGYTIDDKLDKIANVSKAHIAIDVINNPVNKNMLLEKYHHLPSKGEFIETILNEGCVAYIPKKTITPQEAAQVIRNAGGKVVLAHPMAYIYEDNLTIKDVLKIITDIHADGIESHYIYINRDNKEINDINLWSEIAQEYNMQETIGSDFHNCDEIHPHIGLINNNICMNTDIINWLL